ncbi:hypothetical protein [Paenibacillus ihuae]|uniref:hypothetical protein n=1 Tax=Paenibacillus ihuae TaxID=1232431 RepID=UPI0006D59D98|nr:hypothetical protein [Paenibacillus ihuae]
MKFIQHRNGGYPCKGTVMPFFFIVTVKLLFLVRFLLFFAIASKRLKDVDFTLKRRLFGSFFTFPAGCFVIE